MPLNAQPFKPRLIAALLIFCCIAAYIPAISAGFIWDDNILLTANPNVTSAQGLAAAWEGRNSRDYTPLTTTSFWLEWRLWGDSPTGYHVINILLHATSAVLLWLILETLGIPGAWLAALLFAIHPVNVASVAWVAERKNTLSTVLFLGSVLSFLHSEKRHGIRLYIASVALFLLAGFSKGSVVTLPGVLLGCLLWMHRKITRRDLLRMIPFGLIALLVTWFTIHYQMRADHYGLIPDGVSFQIARAGYAVWYYLGGIFFPTGLSPMCPQWHPDLHAFFPWLPALAAVALLVVCLWQCRGRGRALLFGYGYFLWMLLPVLGFVWMTLQQETPCADWWAYLAAPGIFACVAAGFTLALANASKQMKPAVQIFLCAVIAVLFVQTWRRCAIYESMETYCRAVLEENPHAWSMQNNLGVVLKQRGDFAGAAECYRHALQDNPQFMEAHNNLGNALVALGKLPEAGTEFRAAFELHPDNPEILANLAGVYFHEGKIKEAFGAQAAAIKADRSNPQLYNQFGLMLASNKQFDQAAVCFRNGVVLAPDDIAIQINLCRALLAGERKEEAVAACQQALQTARKTGNEKLIQMVASLLNQSRRH